MSVRFSFLTLVLGLVFVASLNAHPFHASATEATFNRETGLVEIGVRLFPDDVELALTHFAGKKIVLEKTPATELDALLLAWLDTQLSFSPAKGQPGHLTWVGKEFKTDHIWLYVTCPLPGGLVGTTATNRVLRAEFSDQLNSVKIRDGDFRATLLFTDEKAKVVK